MSKRKVLAGHCGQCGGPQVRPTKEEIEKALVKNDKFWKRPSVWVSGHLVDVDTKNVVKVRCLRHSDKEDSRHPEHRNNWH